MRKHDRYEYTGKGQSKFIATVDEPEDEVFKAAIAAKQNLQDALAGTKTLTAKQILSNLNDFFQWGL